MFVAIEEMFGVVDHLSLVLAKPVDGIMDHREVFGKGGPEDLGDLHIPAFAEDGDYGGIGIKEELELGVIVCGGIGAASGAKGSEFGVLEWDEFCFLEELDVLWVGTWPTAFDVVDAEIIEVFCDTEFIEAGELESLALGAVA